LQTFDDSRQVPGKCGLKYFLGSFKSVAHTHTHTKWFALSNLKAQKGWRI